MAAAKYYVRTKLISVTSTPVSGALDSIDGGDLAASDMATVITDDYVYHYSMTATNIAEATPLYVRPDTNATDVTWVLDGICARSIHIPFTPEPASPLTSRSVIWVSDGTGYGDAGDLCAKINVGGTSKAITMIDWSEE